MSKKKRALTRIAAKLAPVLSVVGTVLTFTGVGTAVGLALNAASAAANRQAEIQKRRATIRAEQRADAMAPAPILATDNLSRSDNMSIWAGLGQAFQGAGGWGAVGSAAVGAAGRGRGRGRPAPQQGMTARPGVGFSGWGSALAPIAVGGIAGAGLRFGARGVRAVARSAATYCRRHPAWCAGAGGIAGVAALIEGGSLPVVRRGRGRGITPRELNSFKRVTRIINRYCAPVRKAMRAPAMRRSKSCQ